MEQPPHGRLFDEALNSNPSGEITVVAAVYVTVPVEIVVIALIVIRGVVCEALANAVVVIIPTSGLADIVDPGIACQVAAA
jgi:hypothetical protein